MTEPTDGRAGIGHIHTLSFLTRLAEDPIVARTNELRIELPYEFAQEDYEQILHDIGHSLAPHLGRSPAVARASA